MWLKTIEDLGDSHFGCEAGGDRLLGSGKTVSFAVFVRDGHGELSEDPSGWWTDDSAPEEIRDQIEFWVAQTDWSEPMIGLSFEAAAVAVKKMKPNQITRGAGPLLFEEGKRDEFIDRMIVGFKRTPYAIIGVSDEIYDMYPEEAASLFVALGFDLVQVAYTGELSLFRPWGWVKDQYASIRHSGPSPSSCWTLFGEGKRG